jgi:CubicO group peptidase (beta-lactamase class C family)/enterochelin esterase-like enzyme/sugar lactone lactonase YvrE
MKLPSSLRRYASVLVLSASVWIGAGASAQDASSTRLAPVLQPFVDNHILAGAVVLVADPDKILDLEAVGWADIAGKKPMRTDSVFWIASQSKPITATALMILVDEGKVNVDDPVEKYLPEFKGQQVDVGADPAHPQLQAPRHPILVREVLSHTSGLPFSTKIEQPTLDLLPLETRVKSYAQTPLLFQPGTKSKYANAGLNTAGRIVEVVSGLRFEKFLDERIFQPLGMKDTTFYPSKSQIERLAKSYKPNATKDGLEETPIGQLKYPLDDPERQPMPAGGLFSTATDLSIFYRMMANGGVYHGTRILSEKAVKTMTSDQSGEANSHYGFGFGTDGKSFTHGGAYGTNSRFDIEHRLVTVYLVQHAGWIGNGKDILHQFQVAATTAYGAKVAATPQATAPSLVVGINGAPDVKAAAPAKAPAPVIVNRVRFFPAPGREQAMVGGKFSGSNVSSSEGFKVLTEIKLAPKSGAWSEITFDNTTPYRWVRYEAPAGSRGNIAELEFYSGADKLKGAGFGTAGSLSPGGHWKTVFDGKPETWFNSNTPDGQYVGLDLEDQASTMRPVITPGGGDFDKPQLVSMKSATPGAVIRYTLDGTAPTAQSGMRFTQPFTIEKDATITAVAFSDTLAPSPAAVSTPWVGAQPHPPMNSFHVGNSLTGNASRFRTFIRTAGGRDDFPAYLIGGSLTVKLWNESQGADKARWDETYGKAVHPLDYFTLQPRDFNVAEEVDYATRFIKLVREKSPDVQPWLYAEWVEMERARPTDKGEVPSFEMKKTFPALTWQESMGAMLLYNEEVQHRIVAQYHEGKPVRIIPTALALGWARTLIDRGEFPGVSPGEANFYATLFEDHVHVNPAGCFLVGCTWYAALYHESPEGKLLPIGTNLTAEQARILQRLAWDVIKNYPDCGLFENGAEPCARPEIANDGKIITLKSATPGAWFRYTLDGTEPTRTNGYVYCGAISVQPDTIVKAVAYKSGMADSASASFTVNIPKPTTMSDDWGAYAIVPVSAPALVLEAVGAGAEGSAVSINRPAATASQRWVIAPKGDHWFAIESASNSALVLAVARGETKIGTPIVLEKESGQPWQRWSLTKNESGNYSLTPQHAPGMGIDLLGGRQTPGARVDLWKNSGNDPHLQWMIKPLAGSPIQTPKEEAATTKYEPPAIKPEDILPGTTKEFTFTQSKIFPGTTRGVTLFIPAQYDGTKPACVYVKTDGYNPREKTAMETLIATREMPVTVGVFVRPGDVPAPMKGTIGRRNRDFEYDGVSDNNVRFLTEELLPYIAREYQLNLSTDGNDRCMSGGSSGGIAAFTAAWHRPDAFSRVYAASGSFVAFRGGHEFPTMIRKFEARPIRAFLTTGTHDMENCAGDWFLLDQEMDKALKFSGYDYQFRIINGGHGAGYAENYQEAMAYLWRGWPDRVKAGPSAPRAQEILIPGEDWQLVADGFKSTRGPACNADGTVFFADTSSNKIHLIALDGKVSEFVADSGAAHCVTVGADGRLYTISEKSGKLMSYDSAGTASTVMDGIPGHSILTRPDGGLYVTSNGEKPTETGSVWFIKDGKKTQVDTGLKFATGLAYRPDQWLLAVAEGHSKWACSYQVNDDGSLTNKERFFHLHVADWDDDAGPESLCYSLEGRLFAATRSGIQITADDGPTQVILPVPDHGRVTGVCLGGKDKDTLFAFCGNKIWKRKVQQHAMGAFAPWTKVNGTKL